MTESIPIPVLPVYYLLKETMKVPGKATVVMGYGCKFTSPRGSSISEEKSKEELLLSCALYPSSSIICYDVFADWMQRVCGLLLFSFFSSFLFFLYFSLFFSSFSSFLFSLPSPVFSSFLFLLFSSFLFFSFLFYSFSFLCG